jgi:hypothetical protein
LAFDRFLVLSPLVAVAGMECVTHPFKNFAVKVQPAQESGELLFKRLGSNILAPAG